jgi:ribosomal protein S18 acetylase RimI-like enzyme
MSALEERFYSANANILPVHPLALCVSAPLRWKKGAAMITIRPAEAEDLDACAGLEATYTTRNAWQISVEGDPARSGPLRLQLQQVRLPRTLVLALPSASAPFEQAWRSCSAAFVATAGELVCGYMLLQQLPDQAQALLARLLVDSAARGKGAGTELVRAARAWAVEQGLVRLLAHAPLRNSTGIEFYQRRGFRICGLSEHFYASREDALLLERWL